MTKSRLDLTSEAGSTLRELDALIEGELREQIEEAVGSSRAMLASTDEPFGWHFLDLGSTTLPGDIRSAGVFVLPGGIAPPAHRHPNSVQHMRVLSGQAGVVLRSAEGAADQGVARFSIGGERPWLVIPRDVVHEFNELSSEMVVVSFHTVPQTELLEVSASGERTYDD